MYWGTRQLVDVWHAKEIFITENRVPFAHEPDAEGVQANIRGVENDSDRVHCRRWR